MMAAFVTWLRATPVSEAFRVPEAWLWPTFESIHFLGLALVLGVAGFYDLRLMGFVRRIPLRKAAEFLPLAMVGLALNALTGAYFYIAEPFQYSFNIAWWYKVAALVLALANAGLFQLLMKNRALSLPDDQDTPLSFKVAGAISLLAWLSVLFWGRMLPYWNPPGGGAGL
jgi:hypothetical protein